MKRTDTPVRSSGARRIYRFHFGWSVCGRANHFNLANPAPHEPTGRYGAKISEGAPCIFQIDLYKNDWCAVELVGEGPRGGKVVRLFHGKRPGGRQAIVHKSTARVVSGTAAQPVTPRGLQARN
ncbi:hypothetical protein PA01_19090 [Azoarcus sp. PA01]|nr:hypothetical protein PA01_19090 [Azoarcus sp. PA01]